MNPYSATMIFMRALARATGIPVTAVLPASASKPGAGEHITVERTGGGFSSGADRGTFAVQTWAATEGRAAELAGIVCDACAEIMESDPLSDPDYLHICRLEVSGAYSFASGDGWRRWQTVVDAVIQ